MAASVNFNAATTANFLLEIPAMPGLNYFAQTCDVPGLTMAGADTPFKNFQGSVPSNRIDFDPFNFTFMVDEDWSNWWALYDWMRNIRRGPGPITDVMKDLTLHALTSNKTPGKTMKLTGAYPTMVSSLSLESTSTDTSPLVCACTFRFQDLEFSTAT